MAVPLASLVLFSTAIDSLHLSIDYTLSIHLDSLQIDSMEGGNLGPLSIFSGHLLI